MPKCRISIAGILLGAFLAAIVTPPPAWAHFPYVVDGGGIAEKGTVHNSDWLSFSNKGEDLGNATVSWQAFNNLETTLQASRDIGDGNDNTLLTVQEKYLWHALSPSSPLPWQSSFAGGLTYDTARQEFTGTYINIPTTFILTPRINLNLDVGWQYTHPEDQNFLTWGANVVVQTTKTISFTAEEFGKSITTKEFGETSGKPGQQFGIGWQPENQFFGTDLVYGHDINGTASQWLTAAVGFKF